MNPLAHMTVATGTVWLGARLLDRGRYRLSGTEVAARDAGQDAPSAAGGAVALPDLSQKIDYRLVALGALLPDLIDKPLGKILLRGPLDNNGHVFGHTLLFTLTVLLPGAYLLARAGDPRLFAMAVAALTHLALDPVNHAPQTLLWPLLGFDFPHISFLDLRATIITEAVAGLAMLMAAVALQRRGRLEQFAREGRL
jgi:membrane-bound metal-dependent hydrolase YbcI (DUF457 family)